MAQPKNRQPKVADVKQEKLPDTKTVKGKSLQMFRESHDKDYIIPTKIKTALKFLGSSWLPEAEFAKLANVSLADLSAYRSAFEANLVVMKRDGKRVWAGTPALAKQMQEMLR